MRPLPPHSSDSRGRDVREQREIRAGEQAGLPLIGAGEDIGAALVRLARMAVAVHMAAAAGADASRGEVGR